MHHWLKGDGRPCVSMMTLNIATFSAPPRVVPVDLLTENRAINHHSSPWLRVLLVDYRTPKVSCSFLSFLFLFQVQGVTYVT